MTHRRSSKAIDRRWDSHDQRGFVDRLIGQHAAVTELDASGNEAYREKINTLSPGQVYAALQEQFGQRLDVYEATRNHLGQVLSNAFGEGSKDPKNPVPDDLLVIL